VRYKSGPAGPYDELLFVPGNLKNPTTDKKAALSVTRIYVSSLASVVNGRRNWNIPKHLGRFEFTSITPSDPLSPVKVSVYASTSSTEFAPAPFFSSLITPSRYIPSFPFNAKYTGLDLTLIQAPLSQLNRPELVGTEKWISIVPGYTGWGRFMYHKGTLEGENGDGTKYADGVAFPNPAFLGIGLALTDVKIHFPASTILEEGKKDL